MYSVSDKEFLELIRRCSSIKEVVRILGYNNDAGVTNQLFHQRCNELNIDWKKELRGKSYNKTVRTIENVFCEDSTADQTTLRAWYLKGEYSEYQCALCGISEWKDKPLTLRLDHINGRNHDNRLENLRWICPNCDSQQDTYCGKNVKRDSYHGKTHCISCGKTISTKNKNQQCSECSYKSRRKVKERPSKEELFSLLTESNFTQVGKKYNVTDNTIRKWCRDYGIPDKAKDYRPKKEETIPFVPKVASACEMLTKDNKRIQTFSSIIEASKWVFDNSLSINIEGVKTHILQVCERKRKTAYGYKWNFIKKENQL